MAKKTKKKIKKKTKKKNKVNSDKYNEYVDKYNKSLNIYKTVKTSLKSIIKNKIDTNVLKMAILNINQLIVHTYQFLKLYCIHIYDTTTKLPIINKQLINLIMKNLCIKEGKSNCGKKLNNEKLELKKKLTEFYNEQYSKTLVEPLKLSYKNLNTILDYETEDIITNINNHIKEHFVDCFNRYINIAVNKKEHEQYIKNCMDKELAKESLKFYRKSITLIKSDILNDENKCNSKYNLLKMKVENQLLPKLINDNRYKDINDNPLNYLQCMIEMSREIERKNESIFGCFPLRTSIIPKYMKLDTTTLIHLLLPSDLNKTYYLTDGNTKLLQDDIWQMFFNTKDKIFHDKKYKFNHSILTDGIGCSILFIRNDKYDPLKVVKIHHMPKPFGYREFKYVNELTTNEKNNIKNLNLVGIDPGKIRLISATNGIDKGDDSKHNITFFSYSHNQRKHETKVDKYKHIVNHLKKETKVNGLSIEEIESSLSKHSSKSCTYNNCFDYLVAKNKSNNLIQTFYEKWIFRKLKWNSYINKRRSEDWMLNNFEKVFGKPKDTVLLYGDFSENKSMRNCEPTKGKSMRKLFKKRGYPLYLVNEYNTSKKDFLTGQTTETFLKRADKKANIRLVHGLLRLSNVPNNKPRKNILLNRDLNGSMNILIKGKCILNNQKIPDYLCSKQ